MARVEPYHRVSFIPVINGLSVTFPSWRFTCGAVDPADPVAINVDLPAGTITFQKSAFDQFGELYVTPVKAISTEFPAGSNYYLDMRTNDPANPVQSNPLTENFAGEITSPIVADIKIPANALTVEITVREQDPGPPPVEPLPEPPPDPRRDIVSGNWRVKAYPVGGQPDGWALLDAQAHATAFPINVDRLETGESWYATGV